ncbi:nitrate reductase molybdenum cofactor assembly chaperone [Nocardioides sp. zg-ZUI104]|uniref:nitrate reductase molybdenum cofactor assembly chaperone n=1 Tax=Nocardioides faecalis TaxID=2803858 RepID=UPI001BCF6D08|nr:nitrate reductase molybdenum cofactor assembly chaperone [Nocardioides faecalis]MBS4751676.1 nitrate reductase molybdenum cofactor assembly chaperone [Nocardioides faecalis]
MLGRNRKASRERDVRAVWAVCSALLDYPTPELLAGLDDLERLVPGNSDLAALAAHLRAHPLRAVQEEYVATFDHTRKCALYLTYFAYGDTRRRGAALVRFKETYRAGGVEWDEATGELPDHLCAVLQFGATVDTALAAGLLAEHRAGVEMLRLALAGWRNDDGSTGSPWSGALVALCDTLPDLHGDEADAVRRLVEQGPPAEEVGLAGYGADPALTGTGGTAAGPPTGPALIAPATIPVRS